MKAQVLKHSIIMEQTPNPETVKFISNQGLLPAGKVLQFSNINNAQVSPLAKALFSFPFVKEILIADNYVAITKQSFVLWEDILLETRDYIYEYLNSGKPVFDYDLLHAYMRSDDASYAETKPMEEIAVQHHLPENEIEQKIIDILNEYILPAVSQDGGFITFESYQDGIVHLKMRGACSGCPSSVYTLKAGIEALLKKMLPEYVKEVKSDGI